MNFGKRLKEIRKQNGLSQVELAEILGVHNITVSRWESSMSFPSVRILLELISLFNVSSDDLLGLNYCADLEEINLYN